MGAAPTDDVTSDESSIPRTRAEVLRRYVNQGPCARGAMTEWAEKTGQHENLPSVLLRFRLALFQTHVFVLGELFTLSPIFFVDPQSSPIDRSIFTGGESLA